MDVTIFLELDNASYVGLFQVNCAVNFLDDPKEWMLKSLYSSFIHEGWS
jgi:hypothetical protein